MKKCKQCKDILKEIDEFTIEVQDAHNMIVDIRNSTMIDSVEQSLNEELKKLSAQLHVLWDLKSRLRDFFV